MKIGEEFTKSENLEDALCRINAVIADESVNDAHELANPTCSLWDVHDRAALYSCNGSLS